MSSPTPARPNIAPANGSRLLVTTRSQAWSELRRDDGVVVISEPYDDHPGPADVPDRHLVEVSAQGITLTALDSGKGI